MAIVVVAGALGAVAAAVWVVRRRGGGSSDGSSSGSAVRTDGPLPSHMFATAGGGGATATIIHATAGTTAASEAGAGKSWKAGQPPTAAARVTAHVTAAKVVAAVMDLFTLQHFRRGRPRQHHSQDQVNHMTQQCHISSLAQTSHTPPSTPHYCPIISIQEAAQKLPLGAAYQQQGPTSSVMDLATSPGMSQSGSGDLDLLPLDLSDPTLGLGLSPQVFVTRERALRVSGGVAGRG